MKKLLVMMLVAAMSVTMLAGCAGDAENTDASETVSDVVESEFVSEKTSGIVSEENTENVSEESSEEVADYSAESVMTKIDELVANCPYDDPEQIKAAVIGVNLEYISEEDLTTLMDTYGYTLEELKDLFDAYMEQYLLEYRANIADMFIGQEEARITVNFIVTSLCENDIDKTLYYISPSEFELPEECPYHSQGSELTDNQKGIVNYIVIYNDIANRAENEKVLNLLSNRTLPYDAKLNVQ